MIADLEYVWKIPAPPVWTPVEKYIPHLRSSLTYKGAAERDGHVIHAYQHKDTQRHIYLDEDGQAYQIGKDVRVRSTSLEEAEAYLTS
jgi:hypothetical protein